MKQALARALEQSAGGMRTDERAEGSVDRILAAAFFRRRPLQAGSAPIGGEGRVVCLADRAARARAGDANE